MKPIRNIDQIAQEFLSGIELDAKGLGENSKIALEIIIKTIDRKKSSIDHEKLVEFYLYGLSKYLPKIVLKDRLLPEGSEGSPGFRSFEPYFLSLFSILGNDEHKILKIIDYKDFFSAVMSIAIYMKYGTLGKITSRNQAVREKNINFLHREFFLEAYWSEFQALSIDKLFNRIADRIQLITALQADIEVVIKLPEKDQQKEMDKRLKVLEKSYNSSLPPPDIRKIAPVVFWKDRIHSTELDEIYKKLFPDHSPSDSKKIPQPNPPSSDEKKATKGEDSAQIAEKFLSKIGLNAQQLKSQEDALNQILARITEKQGSINHEELIEFYLYGLCEYFQLESAVRRYQEDYTRLSIYCLGLASRHGDYPRIDIISGEKGFFSNVMTIALFLKYGTLKAIDSQVRENRHKNRNVFYKELLLNEHGKIDELADLPIDKLANMVALQIPLLAELEGSIDAALKFKEATGRAKKIDEELQRLVKKYSLKGIGYTSPFESLKEKAMAIFWRERYRDEEGNRVAHGRLFPGKPPEPHINYWKELAAGSEQKKLPKGGDSDSEGNGGPSPKKKSDVPPQSPHSADEKQKISVQFKTRQQIAEEFLKILTQNVVPVDEEHFQKNPLWGIFLYISMKRQNPLDHGRLMHFYLYGLPYYFRDNKEDKEDKEVKEDKRDFTEPCLEADVILDSFFKTKLSTEFQHSEKTHLLELAEEFGSIDTAQDETWARTFSEKGMMIVLLLKYGSLDKSKDDSYKNQTRAFFHKQLLFDQSLQEITQLREDELFSMVSKRLQLFALLRRDIDESKDTEELFGKFWHITSNNKNLFLHKGTNETSPTWIKRKAAEFCALRYERGTYDKFFSENSAAWDKVHSSSELKSQSLPPKAPPQFPYPTESEQEQKFAPRTSGEIWDAFRAFFSGNSKNKVATPPPPQPRPALSPAPSPSTSPASPPPAALSSPLGSAGSESPKGDKLEQLIDNFLEKIELKRADIQPEERNEKVVYHIDILFKNIATNMSNIPHQDLTDFLIYGLDKFWNPLKQKAESKEIPDAESLVSTTSALFTRFNKTCTDKNVEVKLVNNLKTRFDNLNRNSNPSVVFFQQVMMLVCFLKHGKLDNSSSRSGKRNSSARYVLYKELLYSESYTPFNNLLELREDKLFIEISNRLILINLLDNALKTSQSFKDLNKNLGEIVKNEGSLFSQNSTEHRKIWLRKRAIALCAKILPGKVNTLFPPNNSQGNSEQKNLGGKRGGNLSSDSEHKHKENGNSHSQTRNSYDPSSDIQPPNMDEKYSSLKRKDENEEVGNLLDLPARSSLNLPIVFPSSSFSASELDKIDIITIDTRINTFLGRIGLKREAFEDFKISDADKDDDEIASPAKLSSDFLFEKIDKNREVITHRELMQFYIYGIPRLFPRAENIAPAVVESTRNLFSRFVASYLRKAYVVNKHNILFKSEKDTGIERVKGLARQFEALSYDNNSSTEVLHRQAMMIALFLKYGKLGNESTASGTDADSARATLLQELGFKLSVKEVAGWSVKKLTTVVSNRLRILPILEQCIEEATDAKGLDAKLTTLLEDLEIKRIIGVIKGGDDKLNWLKSRAKRICIQTGKHEKFTKFFEKKNENKNDILWWKEYYSAFYRDIFLDARDEQMRSPEIYSLIEKFYSLIHHISQENLEETQKEIAEILKKFSAKIRIGSAKLVVPEVEEKKKIKEEIKELKEEKDTNFKLAEFTGKIGWTKKGGLEETDKVFKAISDHRHNVSVAEISQFCLSVLPVDAKLITPALSLGAPDSKDLESRVEDEQVFNDSSQQQPPAPVLVAIDFLFSFNLGNYEARLRQSVREPYRATDSKELVYVQELGKYFYQNKGDAAKNLFHRAMVVTLLLKHGSLDNGPGIPASIRLSMLEGLGLNLRFAQLEHVREDHLFKMVVKRLQVLVLVKHCAEKLQDQQNPSLGLINKTFSNFVSQGDNGKLIETLQGDDKSHYAAGWLKKTVLGHLANTMDFADFKKLLPNEVKELTGPRASLHLSVGSVDREANVNEIRIEESKTQVKQIKLLLDKCQLLTIYRNACKACNLGLQSKEIFELAEKIQAIKLLPLDEAVPLLERTLREFANPRFAGFTLFSSTGIDVINLRREINKGLQLLDAERSAPSFSKGLEYTST